ncbi:MAG: GNAT family N-acetyltransferase [Candidatus Nanoarchaeia archaeon]
MSFIIRKPKMSDAPALTKLMNDLVREEVFILVDSVITVAEERVRLRNRLKQINAGKSVSLIALDDKKIIASFGIMLEKGRSSHVGGFGIVIAKGYRGQGLGKELIVKIIDLAKERLKGLELIELGVFKDNKPAIKLYKKMGFKQVAVIKNRLKYKGRLTNEIIMHKWL